jgi:hypothetical protein
MRAAIRDSRLDRHASGDAQGQCAISPCSRHFDPFLAGMVVMADTRSVQRVAAIAVICAFFVTYVKAVRELVQIDEFQPAQRVEGVVLDPSGAPIPNMTVTDRTEGWVAVLRSTTTDRKGHFRFSSQRRKSVSISTSKTRCSTRCNSGSSSTRKRRSLPLL